MNEMAGLDIPNGSPFMAGDKQLQRLKKDLGTIVTSPDPPVHDALTRSSSASRRPEIMRFAPSR